MKVERKMQKRAKVIITILALIAIFGIGVGITVLSKISQSMVLQPVNSIDIQQVKDGKYNGAAQNEIVVVELEVYVNEGNITKVDILKHSNGLGGKAEKITEEIISVQSLDVDVISGATYSSNIILKAVENALMKGVNE